VKYPITFQARFFVVYFCHFAQFFRISVRNEDRQVILTPQETNLKKYVRIFVEEGTESVLKEAAKSDQKVVSNSSKAILYLFNFGKRLKMFWKPYLKDVEGKFEDPCIKIQLIKIFPGFLGIEGIEKYSQTRNLKKSCIRIIKWHPNYFKLAIASNDDSIRIYTPTEQAGTFVPVLKSVQQKQVTSMSWRPFTAGELAVGCQTCILLWNSDQNSLISRPLSQPTVFKHENHFPITSLEFSRNGSILASASLNDLNILLWDVDQNRCQLLKKISQQPNIQIKWAPNSKYLCSTTVGSVFYIWNTTNYRPDKWVIQKGFVQSFEFSPCGRFLLFVTSEDEYLYSLGFEDENLFNGKNSKPQQALPIADLSKITVRSQTEIGGKAKSLVWNGKYLALSFKDTNVVAIYHTNIQKYAVNITPAGYVAGSPQEYPSYIAFQPKYEKESADILSIGWSQGVFNARVEYFPLM
jgi:aladin